jgi:hypothetical protein
MKKEFLFDGSVFPNAIRQVYGVFSYLLIYSRDMDALSFRLLTK